MNQTFYDFNLITIYGQPLPLTNFKGKKVLIVNTASACGYTPQYAQLQELHNLYASKLIIIGCPCNDFGNQEPASEAEIAEFCSLNFDVKFILTSKVQVLPPNEHPLFNWLQTTSNKPITWNFQKFLINENGQIHAVIKPSASPFEDVLLNWLKDDV